MINKTFQNLKFGAYFWREVVEISLQYNVGKLTNCAKNPAKLTTLVSIVAKFVKKDKIKQPNETY